MYNMMRVGYVKLQFVRQTHDWGVKQNKRRHSAISTAALLVGLQNNDVQKIYKTSTRCQN